MIWSQWYDLSPENTRLIIYKAGLFSFQGSGIK